MKHFMCVYAVISFGLLVLSTSHVSAKIIFVHATASGANSGTNWEDAYPDLQTALTNASGGDDIWVAEGVYKPTNDLDFSKSFVLRNKVNIFGGFAGFENQLEERDWETHESVLSGDIGILDDISDNSYAVITANGIEEATVDGLIITSGNSNASGGGMKIDNSNVIVKNTTIRGNSAKFYGGGIANTGNLTLVNCYISDNRALSNGGGGGGIWGGANLIDCTFTNNSTAGRGGALKTLGDVTKNCIFINNEASDGGGAIFNIHQKEIYNCYFSLNSATYGAAIYHGNSKISFFNCVFFKNSSTYIGGGIYNANGEPTFVNCTFSGNSADTAGASIYHYSTDLLTIENCILWNNSTPIQHIGEHYVAVNNSITQVTFSSGTGNMNINPKFISSATGDLRLQIDSPAIDTGNSNAVPVDTSDIDEDGITTEQIDIDRDGKPRVQGTNIDMGAFEFDPIPPYVVSITRADQEFNNSQKVNFILTFNEPVFGVGKDSLILESAGNLTNVTISELTGSDAIYLITVNTGDGDGTISLHLIDNDSISDGKWLLGGTGTGNGNFTTGEIYTIDKSPPALTIGPASEDSTGAGPITFPVTYSGASAITLDASDVTLATTGSVAGEIYVDGTDPNRTVTVYGISGDGTFQVSVASGTASDSAGNFAPAITSGSTVTVNNSISYSLTAGHSNILEGDSGVREFSLTITRSGAVSISSSVELSLTGTSTLNSDFGNIVGLSGTSGTITFSPDQISQNITLDILGDFIDEVDETLTASLSNGTSSGSVTYDNTPFTLTIVDDDQRGILLEETGGITTVSETGSTSDFYSVVLTSQPTGEVTISVSPDTQTTVAPTALVFTPSNWSSSQVVTVSAVDDSSLETPTHDGIIAHTANGADYHGISGPSITAKIKDNDAAPKVNTFVPASITATEALLGGIVTEEGDLPITERGVCWSLSPNPAIGTACQSAGFGLGNFTINATGLVPNTNYYVRAYATNANDTSYGENISFTTSIFADVDDNGKQDLEDAILALQILTGLDQSGHTVLLSADVNGDQRIGIEEALYVLQFISELK